ncbi:hypothetical protein LZ31DRAFT_304701 [Colletotrichum somersetense]|nr:hypothetical protein LZ31DRAFT_304701 [Colletotrichum somersetense]
MGSCCCCCWRRERSADFFKEKSGVVARDGGNQAAAATVWIISSLQSRHARKLDFALRCKVRHAWPLECSYPSCSSGDRRALTIIWIFPVLLVRVVLGFKMLRQCFPCSRPLCFMR